MKEKKMWKETCASGQKLGGAFCIRQWLPECILENNC